MTLIFIKLLITGYVGIKLKVKPDIIYSCPLTSSLPLPRSPSFSCYTLNRSAFVPSNRHVSDSCTALLHFQFPATADFSVFCSQGWTKPNAFHVCITSYKLVLQDHQAFRRKSWRYLILDEAQNIKNFKSQRWQSLLNFNRSVSSTRVWAQPRRLRVFETTSRSTNCVFTLQATPS